MRAIRAVFYFEVISNLGSALLALLAPALFLAQFTSEPFSVAADEFARWYGVLLVVLALVLLAALREGSDRLLRPVIAAYLVGDALQIAVAIRLGMAIGGFAPAVHAAIWLSVAYAAVRIYYLCSSGSAAR